MFFPPKIMSGKPRNRELKINTKIPKNKCEYFLLNEGVKIKNAKKIIGSRGNPLTFTPNATPEKKHPKRKFFKLGEKPYFIK